MRTPAEIVDDALRTELLDGLAQCSKAQQDFFYRIFPGGIETLPEDKLRSACDLVRRTIIKNEKDPSRLVETPAS